MQLQIVDEQHIRLEVTEEDGLVVEGEGFGPLQMLAASLALCTASVIQKYAGTSGLHLHEFAIDLRWEYADDPYRVGRYDMTIHVPDHIPAARHRAIIRAADSCTVHGTLLHPPAIETAVAVATAHSGEPPDSDLVHVHDPEA